MPPLLGENRVRWMIVAAALIGLLGTGYLLLPTPKTEPTDFRGMKWGSHAGDLPQMILLAEEGDLKFFEKAKEQSSIGDVNVDKIIYGFHKDRLYNVMIYYSSPADFVKLRDALTKEFGPPFQPLDTEQKCFWNGEQVNLLLNFDEASTTGRLIYLFKPIQLEIDVSG